MYSCSLFLILIFVKLFRLPLLSNSLIGSNMTEILLPANFGLGALQCRVHGNVTLLLADDVIMTANSVILSLNSPVLRTLFTDTGATTLDFRTCSSAAVRVFIRALYCGAICLETVLFREVNKMSHHYEVAWLVRRCREYFTGLIIDMDPEDYDNVFYLLEEARFQRDILGNQVVVGRVVTRIKSSESAGYAFVEKYLYDYTVMMRSQVDVALAIAGDNACLIVKIVITNLLNKSLVMDKVSKYILTQIDLLDCLKKSKIIFDDLFDLLFEKVQNVAIGDLKLFLKMYRKTYESFNRANADDMNKDKPIKQEIIIDDEAISEPSSCVDKISNSSSPSQESSLPIINSSDASVKSPIRKSNIRPAESNLSVEIHSLSKSSTLIHRTIKSQDSEIKFKKQVPEKLPKLNVNAIIQKPKVIPNLFHSVQLIRNHIGAQNMTLENVISWGAIKNLMMLLEALPHLKTMNVRRAIQKLTAGQKLRNWARIPTSFLDSFMRYPHSHLIEQIKSNPCLSSNTDTAELVSVNFTTLRDIMSEEQSFTFRHPFKSTQTFILQSRHSSKHFIICLRHETDSQEEEQDRQHGSNDSIGLSVDKMHLVFKEWDSRMSNKSWRTKHHVTWAGEPETSSSGRVSWGNIPELRKIKLVIYYDVR